MWLSSGRVPPGRGTLQGSVHNALRLMDYPWERPRGLETHTWDPGNRLDPWWRHPMETFSALLALCAGNSPVTGEFPSQRPVTRSFDVFFELRLSKRLGKQSWDWWLETPSRPLWRHSNATDMDRDLVCGFHYTLCGQICRNSNSMSAKMTRPHCFKFDHFWSWNCIGFLWRT